MFATILMFLVIIAFYIGFAVLAFYILYRVIRAAVRDGIKDAKMPDAGKE